MARPFTVVAIIAAHNEADVIDYVVRDLIEQGVSVYFIDDDSTDGTREIVERYVGRGVLAVERFDGRPGVFEWERILRRKAALASTLDADWFIHHDADEFRESPWLGMTLRDAVQHVDALGYNAIDFVLLDFWPVDESFCPGTDVREALLYYAASQPYNRMQIRCWKKRPVPVELAMHGGHESLFPERDVFPIPFLLRHYPFRSAAHGRRKVFTERRPRFASTERERGWHQQYDGIDDTSAFLRSPADLALYNPVAVRRRLLTHRFSTHAAVDAGPGSEDRAITPAAYERVRQALADAVATLNEQALTLAALRNDVVLQNRALTELQQALEERQQQIRTLADAVAAGDERLQVIQESLSWRWTAPARTAFRVLTGREH